MRMKVLIPRRCTLIVFCRVQHLIRPSEVRKAHLIVPLHNGGLGGCTRLMERRFFFGLSEEGHYHSEPAKTREKSKEISMVRALRTGNFQAFNKIGLYRPINVARVEVAANLNFYNSKKVNQGPKDPGHCWANRVFYVRLKPDLLP